MDNGVTNNNNNSGGGGGGGGVADYYAILGVGDELTWKHNNNSIESENDNNDNIDTNNNNNNDYHERFWREITHIQIITIDNVDTNNNDTEKKSDKNNNNNNNNNTDCCHTIRSTLPSALPGIVVSDDNSNNSNIQLWNQHTKWDANIHFTNGIRNTIQSLHYQKIQEQTNNKNDNNKSNSGSQQSQQQQQQLGGIRAKMENKIKNIQQHLQHNTIRSNSNSNNKGHSLTIQTTRLNNNNNIKNFYISYQRRNDENIPAIANVQLLYVRLHRLLLNNNIPPTPIINRQTRKQHSINNNNHPSMVGQLLIPNYQSTQQQQQQQNGGASREEEEEEDDDDNDQFVLLKEYLVVPEGFENCTTEWSIPEQYQYIRDPTDPYCNASTTTMILTHNNNNNADAENSNNNNNNNNFYGGIEAIDHNIPVPDNPTIFIPKLIIPGITKINFDDDNNNHNDFTYVPVLLLRRQKITDEERYHEDTAITDLTVSFYNYDGTIVMPTEEQEGDDDDEEEEEEIDNTFHILGKTEWESSINVNNNLLENKSMKQSLFGAPTVLIRKNIPYTGIIDISYNTKVHDRFPIENYINLPLPVEELPMFCYPTGCKLYRCKYTDCPLSQYYGFVVKNERGDSIYVSCISFMEPLTKIKLQQLYNISKRLQHISLAHKLFCKQKQQQQLEQENNNNNNCILTSFDEMTTFENKTICLVSRYPYWTAFRKFLSHLHILSSNNISDLPLERYISHLLLQVPIPKPGGPNIIIPLPALNEPMILSLPHEKDFPLVDLPYHRLFACLDIKTVVTIVLGLLALERKIIILSQRPSLVLDVCELLRSLLFPFELCAPYVPRLTEPFQSSLDFPGAIFVGIHDDGKPNGLAAKVKRQYPEDSIIVDLDTGQIDCDGDRYETLMSIWHIIPENPRANLVSELETLCRDAGIVDGQEPLDSLYDSAFFVELPEAIEGYDIRSDSLSREPLDDRGIRDAFLRFFCSVLGGYERYLVVPDADFLISGNEWFDAKGFLASVPTEKSHYLNALVSTQLFQSFVQRRTEASDVQCLLFDECLTEFHSTSIPYGRLGGDVEAIQTPERSQPHMLYSLLVDQCATQPASGYDQTSIIQNKSTDASDTDSSFSLNLSKASASVAESSAAKHTVVESITNSSGDIVTSPQRRNLPIGKRYIYCVDGNPCFPYHLKQEYFLPQKPSSLVIEMSKTPDPLLARSERELEEANRRRRIATSYRGLQNQRRCLWQLPKLMGSHFLGAWLLCIPSLVSQTGLTDEQQSQYLLRALGALRLLRSKQRIVPDEAAYRALMVACGRTRSDRRIELVKLFGLLRSDGIFPSAVTLGQYTKALAEGYTKRSSDKDQVKDSGNRSNSLLSFNAQSVEMSPERLDITLSELENQGRKWRQKQSSARVANSETGKGDGGDAKKKRPKSKSWLPVVYSSSFAPCTSSDRRAIGDDFKLFSIWSRTRSCRSCGYIPLEEEVQAGWDVVGGENEIPGAVACPRCSSLLVPMLGYKEWTIEDALDICSSQSGIETNDDGQEQLPPQICPNSDIKIEESANYVTYISPATLRAALEQHIEEYSEEVIRRDRLRQLDPELFINFWWYCARFSLPLPLIVEGGSAHLCAFAAWDRTSAERGCFSAAKVISSIFRTSSTSEGNGLESSSTDTISNENFDESPLLSRFNLQGFYSSVWDHPDLSKLLVTLVEACDKRDFKPVVESALLSNERRRNEMNMSADAKSDVLLGSDVASSSNGTNALLSAVELDIYRSILYLAKYQCTTAFHTFFPATLKPCKGYHFWCALGTPLPIFDRLLRDAVRRLNKSKDQTHTVQVPDASDVALGFRCVFGHLI